MAVGATLATILLCYFIADSFGTQSFVFSWVLNFMLMAWYTVLVTLFPLRLHAGYFNAQNWERSGRVYIYLGVPLYRKLLKVIGWEKLNKKGNPIKKDISALRDQERNTRNSEFGHLIIGIIVFSTAFLVSDSWAEARWLLLLNILLNIYPVLLQRYTRPRYTRIISVLQSQEVSKGQQDRVL
ncbi:hypothetical protein EFB08_06370 [Rufibacter latericius]|uniref:Glycosyl-4,4'-diaponeurosporenoate acyltransferase n=2 Tax=Rufibacter latericius TaxID=2487040 RepID=A0A3M9MVX6_9BACT|nr:hypothetical protein EFB08_06370 [Rufibacter latericius]